MELTKHEQDYRAELVSYELSLCTRLLDVSPVALLRHSAMLELLGLAVQSAGTPEHPAAARAGLQFVAAVVTWSCSLADAGKRANAVLSLSSWITQHGTSLFSILLRGCVDGATVFAEIHQMVLHKMLGELGVG